MTPYLSPKERYATILYNDILQNGTTTKRKSGLSDSQLQEGTAEFRDNPWKYGHKALVCSDRYVGIYKFAENLAETWSYTSWWLRYISTRETRGLRVIGAYKKEYGSNPQLDHVIRTIEYSKETIHHLTESGLYIAG